MYVVEEDSKSQMNGFYFDRLWLIGVFYCPVQSRIEDTDVLLGSKVNVF